MDHVYSDATTTMKPKRRKNFLWSSKPEWVAGLLQVMCEHVDANMRSAQGFKDTVYKGAAQKIKEKFGIEVTAEQCKNQIRHQRTVWTHIQVLKKKSRVSWDENKKMIIMGQEEYVSHIQAFPKDATFLNIPITNYMDLEKVCGEGHATGEWAKSANSQSLFGSQAINLDDEQPNSFAEMNTYASQPVEQTEVDTTEESIGGTKRSMLSSSKGCAPRKKNKTNSVYQSLQDYISLMADSVAKVASAIESTSKAAEERKMYVELLAELSSIPDFSVEEIDLIYDKLSKQPTMIQSFLSKSKESKARWMHKELGR